MVCAWLVRTVFLNGTHKPCDSHGYSNAHEINSIRECVNTPYVGMTHWLNINNGLFLQKGCMVDFHSALLWSSAEPRQKTNFTTPRVNAKTRIAQFHLVFRHLIFVLQMA